jgi:subtilase family serine protease
VPTDGDLASRFPGSRAFTPNQLRTAFGFDALHRAGYRGQGMRIALFEAVPGGSLRTSRRSGVASACRRRGRGIPVGVDAVPSPLASDATVEATLDLQSVMIAAPRAERIDVLAGGGATPWAEVLAAGLDERRLGTLPNVISVSYGLCEPLFQGGGPRLGPAGRRLWDHVSRIAGAAGISVLVSSGDSGSSACAHNVDKVPADDPDDLIALGAPSVGYPASSPVVTGVGGTGMALDKANRIVLQYPWNETDYGAPGTVLQDGEVRFTAGGGTGGTSRLYAAPGYQLDAGIRSARRKVPDVAMYADEAPGVPVYCTAYDAATGAGPCPANPATGSPFRSVGGTSFAAPLLAGGVLIANQYGQRDPLRPGGAPGLARGRRPAGATRPALTPTRGRRRPPSIRCRGRGPGAAPAATGRWAGTRRPWTAPGAR